MISLAAHTTWADRGDDCARGFDNFEGGIHHLGRRGHATLVISEAAYATCGKRVFQHCIDSVQGQDKRTAETQKLLALKLAIFCFLVFSLLLVFLNFQFY